MRESQVRRKIEQHGKTWEQFIEFMANQTVSSYKNGETNYYECDVNIFLKGTHCLASWD